jgi:hypothetical protein
MKTFHVSHERPSLAVAPALRHCFTLTGMLGAQARRGRPGAADEITAKIGRIAP